jgi:hypothetical protein
LIGITMIGERSLMGITMIGERSLIGITMIGERSLIGITMMGDCASLIGMTMIGDCTLIGITMIGDCTLIGMTMIGELAATLDCTDKECVAGAATALAADRAIARPRATHETFNHDEVIWEFPQLLHRKLQED